MMQVDIQQRPKTFVVINPVAGTTEAGAVRDKVRSALESRGIPFEIYETTPESNPKQKVRDAVKNGFELFIAAGGDGTLSSVASGLVDSHHPLVIIPTGTWNALARYLEIPLQFEQALELLFQEHTIRTIDVMQVEKEYYILNISTGLSSRFMGNVKREEKRRFGKLVEVWKGFIRLLEFPSFWFDVKIDGQLTQFRASEMMVANVRNLALKSLELATDIHMDDGKLNVCRIYAKSLRDYLRLAFSMLTGSQEKNWNVLCMEALREVEIRSSRNLQVQGDGDIIGRLPITVKICPKAVSIVTPSSVKL
jgi:YegS/Rv2252/BmrU family lipid kinase